ncbi:polysaccharide deacetylase family protein [Cohnella sp. REN36]|uniref:polysaccharide deacetylase family protein n=1 Tax=Cohnella sp. REN36 TaxID=2887347 RepID=UPI001D154893|nr:polysaccharide deacetylase family protein [Cohnella sp. REN36]MCC3374594.1 polysaccharide deacetylase family protein [Cohnella sp. REN36]
MKKPAKLRRWIALGWCAVVLLSAASAAWPNPRADAAEPGRETAAKVSTDAGLAGNAPASDPAIAGEKRKARKRPPGGNWTELQRRYRGVFVLSASRQSMRIALTFDDVPDPRYTPLVLDILKRKKAPATFFIVGSRAKKHPALVRRIVAEGHAIGNHSYDHPGFSRLPLSAVKRQIVKTGDEIRRIVGFAPRFVRPPYGEIEAVQLAWAKENGYTVVNWDVDSSDWRQLPASRVFANVTRSVRPGSIVLLHAGGGQGQNLYGTARALPQIIDWLRAKGYELVTVPELLGLPERRDAAAPD